MNKLSLTPAQALVGPLYQQVAVLLRDRIEEFEWRPDTAMPNESELAKQFGVSIGTMRKAMSVLESQNFIIRKRGRGTFVVDNEFASELARFPNLYRRDLTSAAELASIEKHTRPASIAEGKRLQLRAGTSVVEIARERRCADAIATFELTVVSAAMFDGIVDVDNLSDPLLFAIYRRDFHIFIETASETIKAVNAEPDLAKRLGIDPGTAVLQINRIANSANGEPIEWSKRYVHVSESFEPDE